MQNYEIFTFQLDFEDAFSISYSNPTKGWSIATLWMRNDRALVITKYQIKQNMLDIQQAQSICTMCLTRIAMRMNYIYTIYVSYTDSKKKVHSFVGCQQFCAHGIEILVRR